MEISFDDMRVTTMTLIAGLEGHIVLDLAYNLLPITRVTLPATKRLTKKCKIPYFDNPGAILSIRYKGETRGIRRTTNKKYFKNSITADVATSLKNVSLKLSPTTIHICGAASEENGREAAQHVLDALLRLQGVLREMRGEPERARETARLLLEATRGPPGVRVTNRTKQIGRISLNIADRSPDFEIKTPGPPPLEAHQSFWSLLASYPPDLAWHSDLRKKVEWILTLNSVVEEPLRISRLLKAMVNYNYSLGFPINRWALNIRIREFGFFSRYNNALMNNVAIELPYQIPEDGSVAQKPDRSPHHTFLVYRSGRVTQSGPGGELTREAYYRFRRAIEEIREEICSSGSSLESNSDADSPLESSEKE